MRVNKDGVMLLLTALAVLFGALAVLYGALAYRMEKITLTYMRGRDLEMDTRNGWIEIHKAMVNLRVQRALVLMQRGAMGAYSSGSPNQFEERERDYILATAQLRGQLDRLNDDPLILELATFLDGNKLMDQWQTDDYEAKFDAFAQSVAMKSRPK
jgi:hypothetical protein